MYSVRKYTRRESRDICATDAALLFRIDKSSLGVPRIGAATPWDDCPYAKSNANTFVRARAYRVFRDRPQGHPSGPAAPSGCPLG